MNTNTLKNIRKSIKKQKTNRTLTKTNNNRTLTKQNNEQITETQHKHGTNIRQLTKT